MAQREFHINLGPGLSMTATSFTASDTGVPLIEIRVGGRASNGRNSHKIILNHGEIEDLADALDEWLADHDDDMVVPQPEIPSEAEIKFAEGLLTEDECRARLRDRLGLPGSLPEEPLQGPRRTASVADL